MTETPAPHTTSDLGGGREELMQLVAPAMGAWTIDSPYHDRAPREVAEAVIAAGWRPVSTPTAECPSCAQMRAWYGDGERERYSAALRAMARKVGLYRKALKAATAGPAADVNDFAATTPRAMIGSVQWADELPLTPTSLACRLNDVWIEATKHDEEDREFLVSHNERAMKANGMPAVRPVVATPEAVEILRELVEIEDLGTEAATVGRWHVNMARARALLAAAPSPVAAEPVAEVETGELSNEEAERIAEEAWMRAEAARPPATKYVCNPVAPERAATEAGEHVHTWVRCDACPNTEGPCICAGGICCDAERAEIDHEYPPKPSRPDTDPRPGQQAREDAVDLGPQPVSQEFIDYLADVKAVPEPPPESMFATGEDALNRMVFQLVTHWRNTPRSERSGWVSTPFAEYIDGLSEAYQQVQDAPAPGPGGPAELDDATIERAAKAAHGAFLNDPITDLWDVAATKDDWRRVARAVSAVLAGGES